MFSSVDIPTYFSKEQTAYTASHRKGGLSIFIPNALGLLQKNKLNLTFIAF